MFSDKRKTKSTNLEIVTIMNFLEIKKHVYKNDLAQS